jgi:hypothetical protein
LPHPPSADAPKATVAAPKAPKPSKGTKKLTIQEVKKLHREATAYVKAATGMVKEATENGDVEGLVLAKDALQVCSKLMQF